MGSVGSPEQRNHTAVRHRLAEAERIGPAERQQVDSRSEAAGDHPSAEPSCVAGHIGRVGLEIEQCPDRTVQLLVADAPPPPFGNSPLPSSSLSTLCEFP